MADTPDAPPMRARKTPVIHIPNDASRQRVKLLVASDVPVDQIAKLLSISVRSFHRHYKRDVEIALVEQLAILNQRMMAMTMGVARNVNRGTMRACQYMLEKAEARLRRHHGADDSASYEADVASTKPTLIRPDEPVPEAPVL